MNKNTGDGELDELKDRAEKMLYDLFYKGLNAGEDTVLQYQFNHELAVKIRYVERCVKGAKDELADILTILKKKSAQEANKAQQQLLQGLMEQKKEFESRIDDVPVYLDAIPAIVIQNKLEGLS